MDGKGPPRAIMRSFHMTMLLQWDELILRMLCGFQAEVRRGSLAIQSTDLGKAASWTIIKTHIF